MPKNKYSNLSVRVSEEDKKNFENFCNSVGLNTSVAINTFIKKVINDWKIPFTIESDPFYSPKNIDILEKRSKDIENGKYENHDLIEF